MKHQEYYMGVRRFLRRAISDLEYKICLAEADRSPQAGAWEKHEEKREWERDRDQLQILLKEHRDRRDGRAPVRTTITMLPTATLSLSQAKELRSALKKVKATIKTRR